MEEDLDFTDDEIREELGKLGFQDVPPTKLLQFRKDLEKLVRHEKSKGSSLDSSWTSVSHSSHDDSRSYLHKERVPLEEAPLQGRYHSQDPTPSATTRLRIGKENRGEDDHYRLDERVYVRVPDCTDRDFSLYEEEEEEEPDTPHIHITVPKADLSETDSDRRFLRRKTLRKADDGSRIIDESVTESDAGSLAELEERLKEVRFPDDRSIGMYLNKKRVPSAAPSAEAPYRLEPGDPRPASVILRSADHPHTRNLRKCDPVSRYQQFKQAWAVNRAPGEKSHKNLRWSVREQMLYQDPMEFKRPQKAFVPNSYVVPTDKKRSSLRWQVRMNIAQGNMPTVGMYDD